MIRLKHFAFIAVIVIATLLVVGNWVTPVHANNAGIVTPMPTSTPVTKLDNPGETSSKEQQEELKSVIQSYFEIRYQALSVSPQPNGFQLDGFGELVSDGFEAKAFLDEELGKLAFEIKHAELNHLRYAEYKYFLDFRNITVDTSTQIATISVIEENAFIDEISIEFDPKNPFVSHSYNLEHTIVLRKEQNRWKIVSDNYTDYLWRMLRQTGKSTDELLRAMKAVPRLTSQGVSAATAFTCNLPADASTHLYNRDDVVSYALAHVAREDYNPDYPDYNSGDDALPWGDCTNFVSQAMYEGGNASMAMLSSLPQPNPGGQVGWYLLNDRQRASAWSDVDKLHEFILDPISTPSAGWTEGPEGCDTTINNLMLGDVIQYDWTGNGTWDHAAVVVNFVGADPYVATHTPDGVRHYTAFSPSYDPNLTQIRFIHIERSDGNPPVKTEITSASDDWGPNLYNCTSSSTNNNEIYFGACANGGSAPSGFRFNNIQIPQGAQIKYAYVNFTVDGPYGVAGSPVSYPIAPISVNIYEGSNTNIVVPWNIDGNSSVPYDTWDWKDKRTTPNIQSIIQNTIRGSGWGNGNPLSIIFANNGSSNMRRVMAFDRIYYQPALYGYSPAKLIVAYDLPVGSPPIVLSVTRASANPTSAASVNFTVTFSEPMTGVDATDFSLTTTGIFGATVSSVSGSGSSYNVAVNTGAGDGAIRLNILDNNSIVDTTLNPLGGAAMGDGNFTTGEVYTVIHDVNFTDQLFHTSNLPTVVSIPNTGGTAIHIGSLLGSSSVGTSWNTAQSFFIEEDNCSGATVLPAATCTFKVRFLPWSLGAKTGVITVPSDAPDQPYVVSLSGNSVAGTQLLTNRSFDSYSAVTNLPNGWAVTGIKTGIDKVDTSWAFHGPLSFKFVGDGDLKILSQTINKVGVPGDDFSFNVMTRGIDIPNDSQRWLLQLMFFNSGVTVENRNIPLTTGTFENVRLTQTYTATTNYTSIMFRIHYSKSSGTAWIDLASLQWAP